MQKNGFKVIFHGGKFLRQEIFRYPHFQSDPPQHTFPEYFPEPPDPGEKRNVYTNVFCVF